MVASWQWGGPISSDSRGTNGNGTTSPFWSINNSRSLDLPQWIIYRTNKKTDSNHILMGRQSKIRSYTKIRLLVLLPVNNEEVYRITTNHQNYIPAPMQLGRIFFPMYHAASFMYPLKYSKRRCIRTPITTWPKQQNYLQDTGKESHLRSNIPRKQL